jgi:hypothetical protein
MSNEEFLKRAGEIVETINCWESLEDEALKLFCLFSRCRTQVYEGQEFVHINYVREKIFNLLIKHPIILDSDGARMFCTMKIEKENGPK